VTASGVTGATVEVAGQSLELQPIGGAAGRPVLVFLHEGLGSVSLWRDFPARVAAATACPAVVYSRAGYGASSAARLPRAPDYMHVEARTILPAMLAALGIDRFVLIGHSDGASIALVHAAQRPPGLRGVAALAPHVFVEPLSVASIAAARVAYEDDERSGLRARLARHHRDVDAAFYGWNDVWLSSAFRDWNLVPLVDSIDRPLLLIQGADDEYGTLDQLDAIERAARVPVTRVVLAQCGHSPQRDQPEATLAAIVRFVAGLPSD
jgi:pimeloyl-ACP methyl ester carboxylesterase